MPIQQEVSFTATPEHVDQFPAVKHQVGSRNPVREQEQSVGDSRAAVELAANRVRTVVKKSDPSDGPR
jgi:hypothetical protein